MSKITTPIADFVEHYAADNISRLHMPAHKGNSLLGCEAFDITEINGADVLYSANGIIDESERNATKLFGTAHTFYSTEGSTLAIKAMLAIIKRNSKKKSKILAARNIHKAFIYACALLDFEVDWIYPDKDLHICDCSLTPSELKRKLSSMSELPCALYVTSPTYLGEILDIKGLSEVCKEFGIYLLVDNAHGAYLAFERPSRHPIALGADMCCDSAHKTLPTLTGGAYLHISKSFTPFDKDDTRNMLSLFASTSPSYLTLQSLDLTNAYLANGFSEKLAAVEKKVDALKNELAALGFDSAGDESLKIVITRDSCSYSGIELAALLRKHSVEPEYADLNALVLMISTETADIDFERIKSTFASIPARNASVVCPPRILPCKQMLSLREAIFSQSERINVKKAVGRICAAPSVSCPPAIPPIVSGELITAEAAELLLYYGIEEIDVIKL